MVLAGTGGLCGGHTVRESVGRTDVTPTSGSSPPELGGGPAGAQPQGFMGEALPRARAPHRSRAAPHRFRPISWASCTSWWRRASLHRYVDAGPPPQALRGSLLSPLGVAEAYISRTSWIAETPFFLEVAIKLDPPSPMAAQAYDLLNAYILASYTAPLGCTCPRRCRSMEGLRRLRQGSRAGVTAETPRNPRLPRPVATLDCGPRSMPWAAQGVCRYCWMAWR